MRENRGAFGTAEDRQVFRIRTCYYHDIVDAE